MKVWVILISIFGILFYAGEKYCTANKAEILTWNLQRNEAQIAQARERIEFLENKNKMMSADLKNSMKSNSQ